MTQSFKMWVLSIFAIPHHMVIGWRLARGDWYILKDRPLWYVKFTLTTNSISEEEIREIYEEDEADDVVKMVTRMYSEALEELKTRERQNLIVS